MVDIYNEALENAKIPKTWTEACITLIHKEQTDPQKIQNYRPISLLNVDYKIMATIMAERLKRILSRIIHTDQNGFLPHRQIKTNTRIMIDILEYYETHTTRPVTLMFVDAQKAFDNLNWNFLIKQLTGMKCGENFLGFIKQIYNIQTAKVLINGEATGDITINKGVRQGCLLAPLLYILAEEILLTQIRQNQEIKGLKIKKEEYKLQAFADDMVFILEEPIQTGPRLLQEIEEYGRVAGLKVNKDKTKILTKNCTKHLKEELSNTLGIQTVNKVKYLGILLTPRCSAIRKENYDKLISQITKDLENWSKLQLSLLGHISTIKMNILPKLLFLFQTAPVRLEKFFFIDLNKHIHKFIWQKKKPRIKLKILQDAGKKGGFGLPDFELYYEAAIANWLRDWAKLEKRRILILEGFDLQLGWHAFMWDEKYKNHAYFRRHYVRNVLISVWEKMKKNFYLKVPLWISTLEAVTHPNVMDYDNIIRYKDLLLETGELKNKNQIIIQGKEISWWPFLQIQTQYKKDLQQFGFSTNIQEFDKIWLGEEKKSISRIYRFFLNHKLKGETMMATMIKWTKNMAHNIEIDEWEHNWQMNYKLTLSTAYKENLYKMIYRWHLSPARLAKISPNLSPKCWKCNHPQGTYFHMWWTCSFAKKYWRKVKSWIFGMTKQNLNFDPEVFLLGMINLKMEKKYYYLILHIITVARLAYAQNWKSRILLPDDILIKKIHDCAEMDSLTKKIKNKQDSEYCEVWDIWDKWIKEK
uniref:Reverse transcriptase domain-containing protein n=1 Tax=Naja naja TaxID=35670 RepID=A0A8C7E3S4_NAJNA